MTPEITKKRASASHIKNHPPRDLDILHSSTYKEERSLTEFIGISRLGTKTPPQGSAIVEEEVLCLKEH